MASRIDAEHINSEGERIVIARATTTEFAGQPLLVIFDDPAPRGTSVAAPMLLDAGTRTWLRGQLDRLDAETRATRAAEVGPHGEHHRRNPDCTWPTRPCICDAKAGA